MTTTTPTSAVAARLLADLVDLLLPGEGDWPSGATIGVQSTLAIRLVEERGEPDLTRLAQAILRAGGPFAGQPEERRVAIAEALEAAEPELFGWVRDAAYYAYYESPYVVAVINAQGHPYRLRPHVKGYPLPRFDPARDAPKHGRGLWLATGDVRPVDISALELDSDRTQAWGLKR
ncbi:hypothetical protein [Inquilinus limosus]|uniref:Gluconate 2-dehydrogenase subunit 3 family protein n=1 Tax=Inquilinus limosus MP06 TaxID=1398085 RepID=A0A0A0D3W8_9PROT|nr:hypothetical protein [Inquilinus limosus]KGM33371.1 hypothetical protein P409_16220 [Inquilinus limosus MP06]